MSPFWVYWSDQLTNEDGLLYSNGLAIRDQSDNCGVSKIRVHNSSLVGGPSNEQKKRLELWPGQCASDIHTPFDVIKSWLVIKRAWYTRTTPRIYSFWQSGKDNKKKAPFSNYWFATVHKNNKRRNKKTFFFVWRLLCYCQNWLASQPKNWSFQ